MKNIEDLYPLSPTQQGMLFHSLYAPDSGVYVTQICLGLRTELDIATFISMWEEVIKRHPILRTAFIWEGLDEPLQVVCEQVDVPYSVFDWREQSAARQQEELQAFLAKDRVQGFDLSHAPLMRVTLFQFQDEYYQLVWSFHHILLDGWSLSRIMEEIFVLYKAASEGYSLSLEPGRPFKDYIGWLLQQDNEEAEKFWKDYLKGFSDPTPLAMGQFTHQHITPEVQEYAEEKLVISDELTAALQAVARHYQLTVNTLLETAWAVLLSWYSGEEDVLFGTTSSGRSADLAGITSMVGLFITMLPLRARVSPSLPFIALASKIQAGQMKASSYEHSSLVQIHGWSEVPRGVSLFESIFIFENYPISSLLQEEIPDLEIVQPNSYLQTNYPLAFVALPGRTLELLCKFDGNRFEAADIARMLELFQVLLTQITAQPEEAIGNILLLPEKDRRFLFRGRNEASTQYTASFVYEMVEARTLDMPENLAVRFKQETLTYRDLNQRANQLAHYLMAKGVGPDVTVGICIDRSLDMIVAILGIMKAGGAYVPLNPDYPQGRLALMLEDAQISLLLTHQSCLDALPSLTEVEYIFLDREWEQIAGESGENPGRAMQPENLAYIIYTSGSTGTPKGVLVEHYGLGNLIEFLVEIFSIKPDSRVLQFYAPGFDASIHEIFMALAAGAQLHIFPQDTPWSLTDMRDTLQEQTITIACLPPSLLRLLPVHGLPALQTIVAGGEICSADVVELWAPTHQFFNAYGPTEATIIASITRCQPDGRKPGIGFPIRNAQIYILDGNLHPVPTGIRGEIYIGGVGVARGYLHRADRTAEYFIPDPFSAVPGMRMYKTGDQARFLPDGTIEFLGRLDSQVKVRGFRIELEEIQALLLQHEAVQDAAVVLQGEEANNKRIATYIVPDKGHQQASGVSLIEELKQFLQQYLPDYMLSSAFCVMDALPRTSSGKLNVSALPMISASSPAEATSESVEPQTIMERRVASIWQEVLHVEKVGIHDNFFELGAHSLLMLQAHSKLQEAFEMSIPLADMFAHPTISSLSQYLSRALERNGATGEEAPVDLDQEAILDPSIVPTQKPDEIATEINAIFMTGLTGFLGAYLLKELLAQTQADIYCLVRAASLEEGKERIRKNLEFHGIYDKNHDSRIIPVIGNLTQPLLGLSPQQFELLADEIDVIYHCGASVNFTYPYQALKAVNVLGTQEVLRLAGEVKVKPVHYISSLAVLTTDAFDGKLVFFENSGLDSHLPPAGGYAQSKWVGEKLMMQARSRGIPVCIYRSSLISGDRYTGINHTQELLWAMIKGCIQLGTAPQVDIVLDLVPVDYVSKAIVHLSKQEASLGKAFHICNPQALFWKDLVSWMQSFGYSLRLASYNQWRETLYDSIKRSQHNALQPFLSLFPLLPSEEAMLELETRRYYDCQNTAAGLAGSSITCPPIEDELLNRYFSYFIQTDFLPARR